MKNTMKEYTFTDGRVVKVTMTFMLLLSLRDYNKRLYEIANRVTLYGAKELYESAVFLYAAYVCACLAGENGGKDAIIPEKEFIDALEDDILGVMAASSALIAPKKK